MGEEAVAEKWEWFCGVNSTDLDFFLDFDWSKDQVLNNTCLVDAFVGVPHTASILVFSLLLLLLKCTMYRTHNMRYLIRFPGHGYKWLFTMLQFVILFASIGEGILTDKTYPSDNFGTQPHFYIAPTTAFVGLMLSLVFYQMMEMWNAPYMVFFLVLYWIVSVAAEASQMLNLLYQQDDILVADETILNIMKFDLVICRLTFYSLLLLLDLNVIRAKVFKCCRDPDADRIPKDLKHNDMLYVQDYVNLASESTYWWVNWLLKLGYKRPLEMEDLGSLPEAHEARANHEKFWKAFMIEKKNKAKNGQLPSMWKVYWQVYGFRMSGAAFLKLASDFLNFVGPLSVGGITLYVTAIKYPDLNPVPKQVPGFVSFSEYFANGIILVLTMFVAAGARAVCLQAYFHWVILESIHVRSALQTMVYEKSLRLSTYATTGGLMTMGQITNHMSTDAMAILYMFQTIHYLITIPIQLAVTLVLLYLQMGYSSLIGASVFLIIMPIQFVVASKMSKIQKEVLKYSDDRLKQSNELLNGIKLLKLYGWEGLYCSAIEAVRNKELWAMLKINVCVIITIFFTWATPMMVTLVAFGIYEVFEGDALTPDVAFSSLALFNQLAMPLFILPMSLAFMVNAIVSSKRLQGFLTAPEVEKKTTEEDWRQCHGDSTDESAVPAISFKQPGGYGSIPQVDVDVDGHANSKSSLLRSKSPTTHKNGYGALEGEQTTNLSDDGLSPDVAVKIQHGSFTWDEKSTTPILDDINLEIPAGKLTIIVGTVGSGKSSLLSAILGEMTTLRGTVEINKEKSSLAYAAQKAWLLNASLKENILFGQEDNHRRYKKVIEACALQADLDILPAGDQTEIGEKGINLSGGQKQRVSVGRTMYSGRDIIILDDPLSALDVHVGGHLFQEGIMDTLVKNKQTVILVTHQLQYLQYAHLALVMKDGKIQHQGTMEEIQEKDPELYNTWQDMIHQQSESEAALEDSGAETDTVKEERERLKKQVSRQMSVDESKIKDIDPGAAKLIEKEEMERGSVSLQVYNYYLKAMGYWLAVLVATGTIMQTCMTVGTNFWLTAWSEAGLVNDTSGNARTTGDYIAGYAGLSIATICSQLLAITTLVFASLIAARKMHLKMLHNVIRVPLRFFDTTPIGRILNRFSSDTQLIDQRLAQTFNGLLGTLMQCLAALVVNAIVIPWFILVVLPVAVGYYFLQKYFITTSRELQRLDSVTKSPVFAYFSETLGGLATIRAYNEQKRFYNTIMERININLGAYLYLQTVNRWLGVRLDLVGGMIVLLAGLCTVIGAIYAGIDPSLVGLAITYSLQVSGYLNWLVRNAADIEMQMNAVERVQYYSDIPNEPYEGLEPPMDWPKNGEICIENVSVRYAKDLDAVLKGVKVDFPAGQKIGICGRTGSGKSSLTLALFRIIDTFEGRIVVDGIDIATVPLTTLRQKLSIIPQDPVLFTGTIRKNLDPVNQCTDEELWDALEIAQLKSLVTDLENGLESMVTEGGENYSVGQRQLFCLARAFLRKSRILVMDEATASIDMETDKILQKVVATAFADRTVLTIAHRVATIMDSDTILVLSDGKVVECDSPQNLMAIEDSVFASLVKGNK